MVKHLSDHLLGGCRSKGADTKLREKRVSTASKPLKDQSFKLKHSDQRRPLMVIYLESSEASRLEACKRLQRLDLHRNHKADL